MCGPLREPVPGPGKLDIRRIFAAGRGNGMNSAALRAAPHECGQDETRSTTLAHCRQPPCRQHPLLEGSSVGPRDKLHQFPPFGKRPLAAGVTASAISHHLAPFVCVRDTSPVLLSCCRGYTGCDAGIMMQVKKSGMGVRRGGNGQPGEADRWNRKGPGHVVDDSPAPLGNE